VYEGYARLLKARAASPAFHPYGAQMVVDAGQGLFSLLRFTVDGRHQVLCLHNVTAGSIHPRLNVNQLGLPHGEWVDLISGQSFILDGSSGIIIEGYRALWLQPKV
jgi:sucrose phosphorylase